MRERWLFDLTDREGAPVRRLENVVSASLVGNVNRQIRWDGRLELGGRVRCGLGGRAGGGLLSA